MLPSFEAVNFRSFRHLVIPRLGRVNLVVGRNNSGKTNLLDAMRVWAAGGADTAVAAVLASHDELGRAEPEDVLRRGKVDVDALFPRRLARTAADLVARLGPAGSEDSTVVLNARHLREEARHGGTPVDEDTGTHGALQAIFVPATGIPDARAAAWWDEVSLTDAETRVLDCVRIAASEVQGIRFVANPSERIRTGARMALVRLVGDAEPVPLRSLGDAMFRMFTFSLALERSRRSGLLLIDEIENGIHYTVLPDLWRFIFAAARRLDVQVVATSHSWDCIEAFQEVAAEDAAAEGVLIRLDRDGDEVRAVVYSEEELAMATRQHIEVR